MIPLDDLAAIYKRRQAEVLPEMQRAMLTLMDACAEKSKTMIGQEHADWPPLAASTVAEKTRAGYVGHISDTDPLLRTGHLRDSIQAAAAIEGDGVIGIVGTDVPYAEAQERGTARIPPRPFLSPPIITSEPAASVVFGELAQKLLDPRHL